MTVTAPLPLVAAPRRPSVAAGPVLLALSAALTLVAGRLVAVTTPSWAPLVVAAGEASQTVSTVATATAGHVRGVAVPVGAAAQAHPLLVLLALAAAVVAEVALVATHRGSVDHPLPWRRTAVVTFAATKLGALTPAQSGDLALRMRFLHREGVDRPAALRSLAVRSSGTGAVQATVAAVALLAVGSSLASPTQVLHIAGGVAVMLFVLAGVLPRAARWVLLQLRRLAADLRAVTRSAQRSRRLFGGATVTLACRVLSLTLVLQMTGVGLHPEIALLALVAGAAGQGMVGAIGALTAEATLAAGLMATGVAGSAAVQSAVLFRAVTFWLFVPLAVAALLQSRRRRWV